MRQNRFSITVGTVIVLLILAVAGTAVIWPTDERRATVSPPKMATTTFGGPFALIDHHGRAVTDRDYRGHVLLVFFGYTFCPDVCPTTLNEVAEALEHLGPLADWVQPLFVTIDPVRDTPDHLAEYVGHFDRRITGLTGTVNQIRAIANAYHVRFAKVGDEADAYLMDHTAIVFVMGADGRFIAHMPHGVPGRVIAERLRPLAAEAAKTGPTSAGER